MPWEEFEPPPPSLLKEQVHSGIEAALVHPIRQPGDPDAHALQPRDPREPFRDLPDGIG